MGFGKGFLTGLTLGITHLCGNNHETVNVPAWTEYHETLSTCYVQASEVKAARAEKLSGNGTFKNLKIQNGAPTFQFVSDGPAKLKVKVYVVTQNPINDNEVREEVQRAIGENLTERVYEGGKPHDKVRTPTEVGKAAIAWLSKQPTYKEAFKKLAYK